MMFLEVKMIRKRVSEYLDNVDISAEERESIEKLFFYLEKINKYWNIYPKDISVYFSLPLAFFFILTYDATTLLAGFWGFSETEIIVASLVFVFYASQFLARYLLFCSCEEQNDNIEVLLEKEGEDLLKILKGCQEGHLLLRNAVRVKEPVFIDWFL